MPMMRAAVVGSVVGMFLMMARIHQPRPSAAIAPLPDHAGAWILLGALVGALAGVVAAIVCSRR